MTDKDTKGALVRGAAMALDVGTGLPVSGVLDVLSMFTGSSDRRIEDAAREMYQDLALELDCRVRALESELRAQGRELEKLPDILVAATVDKLRRDAIEGTSPERLDALLNATARQFDPEIANVAARKYWLDRLAKLSDLEIFLLVNIGRPPVVMSSEPRGLFRVEAEWLEEVQRETALLHDHAEILLGEDEETFVPLQHGLARLYEEGLAQKTKSNQTVAPMVLTKHGKLLAKLASRPGGSSPESRG